ncbi:MAG: sulfide dehydrogenase [Candidatus Acidiferrales bacterium]
MSRVASMKYLSAIILAACFGLLPLAAQTAHDETQLGVYTSGDYDGIAQTEPRGLRPGAIYSVDAYPLDAPRLAAGEGRELVASYCNTCHSTRYITMQPPLPAATWDAEVNKMVKTFGQPIPTDAVAKIIAYLQSHYTPETRKE